tara:strand:+ start:540 stop:893 length:354 start_codon:yes stop_codon:yes gene_type:complete
MRDPISQALEAVGKEFDVMFKVGDAGFTDNTVTFKLEGSVVREDGLVFDQRREDYIQYWMEDKTGFALDDTFNHRGREYRVAGYARRAQKYKLLCERVGTDDLYKFTIAQLEGKEKA